VTRRGLCWQEMVAGQRQRTARRTITETDLVGFVTATGFFEPLFLDAGFAAAQGIYAGRLVPGALTFTYAEGLVIQTGVIHGTGLAFLGMELRVEAPVVVGDTIEVEVEVTESRASSTAGRGVVTTRNLVLNQRGQVVMTYSPVRLVKGADA
jgi:acyl dehydratase